jgi:serine/threonine-protein kinase
VLYLTLLGSLDLRTAGGVEVRAVLRQPKRLALLAYLALEGAGRFVRRDTLLALFWPELDQEHARAALRRAVYFLRKALGQETITGRGDDELGLDPAALTSDVARFTGLLEQGDVRGALDAYAGDLMPGFYISGAPEAERWLDGLRAHLHTRAVAATWALAEAAGIPPGEAADWGRRALRMEGDDEGAVMRLMHLLDRIGDPNGALEVYALLERRRASEDDHPSARAALLAREIASQAGRGQAQDTARRAPMVVAVLPFAVHGNTALDYLGEGTVALLATALDGLGELRTVTSQALLTGLAAEPGPRTGDGERRALDRLGATHALRGTIVEAGGQLRVVATLETARGETVARAEARGDVEGGLFDALDRVAQQLVGAIATGPATRIARIAARTTAILPALRAYLRGERAFRLGCFDDAVVAYEEAARLDEGFALAWYRLAGARAATTRMTDAWAASRRAMEHAARLAPHDRVLVEAQDAWLAGRLPDAERRYAAAVAAQPDDLEAWYLLGDALFHAAPYHGRSIREARAPFERALALDPSHVGALHKLARLAALDFRDAELDAYAERFLRLSPDADQALAVRTLRAFRLRRLTDKAALLAEFRGAGALAVANAFSDAVLYGGATDEVAQLGGLLVPAIHSPELRALCRLMLGFVALARGRIPAGHAHLDAARADDLRWSLEAESVLAATEPVPLGEARVEAVRAALTALDPADAPPNVGAPMDLHNALHAHIRLYALGLLAARAGDVAATAGAAELLAELDVPRWAAALVQRMARTLDALLRRARGDHAGALAVLEGAQAGVWFQFAVASPAFAGAAERLLRAELLMEAGRTREAAGWLAAIGERSPWELPFVAPARRLEARCHEGLGDRDGAARCWRDVARWYEGAEGPASPVLAEATDALKALVTPKP